MATQLSRSFGEQGNQRLFTVSFWVKRTKISYQCGLFGSGGSGNYATSLFFSSDDTLRFWNYWNGGYDGRKYSSAKFRDTNAWYHIVIRVDTANSTASERMRVYVNGEEMDYGGQNDNPSQDRTMEVGHNGTHYIGGYGTGAEFEGLMSHFHYCDGYSYAPTEFGSTDSTTGEWKINTSPNVQYGTTGVFILKDGNSVTDQSGLSHNWTVANGTLTNTEDCPSNVFATMNALFNSNSNLTYANGNTKPATTGQWLATFSTLPMFQGKYYWEFKGDPNFMLGVAQLNSDATETAQMSTANTGYSSRFATGYEIINGGNKSNNNNSSTSYGPSYSSSDIGMIAFDATNGLLWFGKNGTWSNSATQTQIENGTSTYAAYTGLTSSYGYVASCSVENGHVEFNFGNGYFGTTAVSSAGTNASNIGIFEYDVPSGFTALCTKGLNE